MRWLGQIPGRSIRSSTSRQNHEGYTSLCTEERPTGSPSDLGDSGHPFASHCVLNFADEYLDISEKDDETSSVARIIATYLAPYLVEKYPRQPEVPSLGNGIPERVRRLVKDAFNPQRQQLELQELTNDPAIIDAFENYKLPPQKDPIVRHLDEIWKQTDLEGTARESEERRPCNDPKEAQGCLKYLRSIVFTDNDESGPRRILKSPDEIPDVG